MVYRNASITSENVIIYLLSFVLELLQKSKSILSKKLILFELQVFFGH